MDAIGTSTFNKDIFSGGERQKHLNKANNNDEDSVSETEEVSTTTNPISIIFYLVFFY